MVGSLLNVDCDPSSIGFVMSDANLAIAVVGNYVLQFADDFTYTDPVSQPKWHYVYSSLILQSF